MMSIISFWLLTISCFIPLIQQTQAQEYLIAGAGVGDPESQYKFWSFPRVEVLTRNAPTKLRFAAWVRRDPLAVIMGHGHAADVGGWEYQELWPLIRHYDRVIITGCAQNYETAEKSLWRLWGGPDAQKNKYFNCVVLNGVTGVYTLGAGGGGCNWVNDLANMNAAHDAKRQAWVQAQAVVLPIITAFREKVVFMTPRVLNMVLPAGVDAPMQLWLTPSDQHVAALGLGGGAAGLAWQLQYDGTDGLGGNDNTPIPNAPALVAGVSTRTNVEINTFRASAANVAHIARLTAKQQRVAANVNHGTAANARLVNLDVTTLSALPIGFNGVPQFARALSAAAEQARVAAAALLAQQQQRAALEKQKVINEKQNKDQGRRNSIGLLFIQRKQQQQQKALQPY